MSHVTALDRSADGGAALRHRVRRPARWHRVGRRLRRAARLLRPSLTVGLAGLAVLLVVLPITYYDQHRQSERKYGAMLRLWADNENQLAARALAPLLNIEGVAPFRVIQDQLDTLPATGRRMFLMFSPVDGTSFYLVASTPRVSLEALDAEWRQWHETTNWPTFDALCGTTGQGALAQRGSDSVPDTIRSLVPIATPRGCWILISAFDTSTLAGVVDAPKTSWMSIAEIAAAAYIAVILLAALLWFQSWHALNRFGQLAREISERGAGPRSFADGNDVPELAGMATDFDRLVTTLQSATETVKRSAEDNAHALKTPLATIRHSLQPIKRSIATDNDRAKRAVDLIEQSIGRLETLVSAAQAADRARPQATDATPRPTDLSKSLSNVLFYYQKLLATRGILVAARVEANVLVEAAPSTIESVVTNVIDNAIGFSPKGGEIAVRLATVARFCEITIEDSGPGVEPLHLERIFDRYVSLRPARATTSTGSPLDNLHSGLGLWIVRRDVEALGGTVMAANRPNGGLSIRITLPLA